MNKNIWFKGRLSIFASRYKRRHILDVWSHLLKQNRKMRKNIVVVCCGQAILSRSRWINRWWNKIEVAKAKKERSFYERFSVFFGRHKTCDVSFCVLLDTRHDAAKKQWRANMHNDPGIRKTQPSTSSTVFHGTKIIKISFFVQIFSASYICCTHALLLLYLSTLRGNVQESIK